MFRRSEQRRRSNTNGCTVSRVDRTTPNGFSAKNILHKKVFPPFWKRYRAKHMGSNSSVFSWDEASYESQNVDDTLVTINHIPTAIEYLPSSSTDHSLENEELMEAQSRYSVPMEIDQQLNVMEVQFAADHCHLEDNVIDKYCIVDEEDENYDDEDDDRSTLFGSLETDSFTSDTALRDEINIEREKIKHLFMIANEERKAMKQPFFNVSACFGHVSANSRNDVAESPTKHAYAIHYKLESDQRLRLD